jgi:hypothetical protein
MHLNENRRSWLQLRLFDVLLFRSIAFVFQADDSRSVDGLLEQSTFANRSA